MSKHDRDYTFGIGKCSSYSLQSPRPVLGHGNNSSIGHMAFVPSTSGTDLAYIGFATISSDSGHRRSKERSKREWEPTSSETSGDRLTFSLIEIDIDK
nr:hypothetical protein CFP56_30842 [Quercus suber]